MPSVSAVRFPIPSDEEVKKVHECCYRSKYKWKDLYFSFGLAKGFTRQIIKASSLNKQQRLQFDHANQRWFPRQVSQELCYIAGQAPFKLHQLQIITKVKFNPALAKLRLLQEMFNSLCPETISLQLPLAAFNKEEDRLSYDFYQGVMIDLDFFSVLIEAECEEPANAMFLMNGYLF